MPSAWIETYKTAGGRKYAVVWETVVNGARHRGSKSCGQFKDHAEAFRTEKLRELYASGLGVEYQRNNAAWSDFADAYMDHCRKHKAPRTVRNFDARAMALAGDRFRGRPPSTITAADVAAWETDLLVRFNPTTARMWLRCLRTALRWGKAHGWVREVPTFHLPRVEPTGRALSDGEVQAILAAVSDRARPAVIFALYTGLRRGELLALSWDRVRKAGDGRWEAEIGGVGGPTTKTGKSRVIPLHPLAVKSMGPPGAGRVFPGINEDLSHRVEEAAKKAGLGRVRFHDLRHTWATKYMQTTGDLFGLMQLGGWSNLGSVRVYQHLTKARTDGVFSLTFTDNSPIEKIEDRRKKWSNIHV